MATDALKCVIRTPDGGRTALALPCSVGTCAGQLTVWIVLLRHRTLLAERATPRRITYVSLQLMRAPMTFLLSIPVTLMVGPGLGMLS